MAGDERVSRRELLKRGVTLRSGLGVGVSVAALRADQSSTEAWVLKPDSASIAGARGTIERSVGSMVSICTIGQEYHGRTCDGQEIQLLVPNRPLPNLGATYRFELADRENSCDETFVELSPASPCPTTSADDSERASSESTTSTSDPDSASADETDSAEDPTTTSATDSAEDSTSTTESVPDSTTTTPERESDDSDATESESDATESEGESRETTAAE